MALSVRQEGSKQVPWFSLTEWHEVYKQIYSNDIDEQTKGYSMLIAWKARIPKLPVGVDCTLSIMHICLRDREWTSKINNGELTVDYENDLCLMYSTTIMRLLNHITNIGHTKQTSLYQIAKQLNIPEWIVNLRHDTAHGYELPSLDILRIAVNVLLAWLHEEYWVAEAKRLTECYIRQGSLMEAQANTEVQEFGDLIELWTAVSLYIHAGYQLVSNIPDLQLKETLQDLRSYAVSLLGTNSDDAENDKDNYIEAATDDIKKDKKYTLETARIVLLSEISRYLNRRSIPNKIDIVCRTLFNSEAFLPNKDMLSIFTQESDAENEIQKDILPLDMMTFWKHIIYLLHEKNLMDALIVKLLELVDNEEVDKDKRILASLWISSICYSFVKLHAAHCISRDLEYQLEQTQKQLSAKDFELKVQKETDYAYPYLKCILWFNLSSIVLPCLTDMEFVSKLILNAHELSAKFIVPVLELVSPKIDKKDKDLLLNLIRIYAMQETNNGKNSYEYEKIFTLKDILQSGQTLNKERDQNEPEHRIPRLLNDQKVRNNCWKTTNSSYNWTECPMGLLPWQSEALEFLNPLDKVVQKHDTSGFNCQIIPGIIDRSNLKMQNEINWNNVLRKKKRLKRKYERRNVDVIMNNALETAKKRSKL